MRKQSFAIPSALVVLASLAYLPFVYRGVLGEWDSFRMANGIIYSIKTGDLFQSPLVYNPRYSFGYNALLYLFIPILKTNWGLITTLMNYINAISAILMIFPFFFVIKRYWGTAEAILAKLPLIFVPSWWNSSLYGHPQ